MYEDLKLSPAERRRYEAQLREFQEVALPDILRRRDELAGTGDEDEYDDIVESEGFVGGAIGTLREALPRGGSISAEEAAAADYVRLGSRVLVRHNDRSEYVIIIGLTLYDLPALTPNEHGSTWRSGVATALKGKHAGDVAVIDAPSGKYTLRILSVQQPVRRSDEDATPRTG